MKLSKLIYENEYKSEYDASGIEINSIVSDTSKMREGAVFVCLKGTKTDSHTFLEAVYRMGAAAIIVERGIKITAPSGARIFEVENTHRTLSYMWSRYYGNPQRGMKIIGITGTNGKTTVSYMITAILKNAGIKTGMIGTVSVEIDSKPISSDVYGKSAENVKTMTTPDPDVLYHILRIMKNNGVRYVIMEVSSHALYFDKTAPITFDFALFTNLSSEHMDFHGNMENYLSAKKKLFLNCRTAVINADDTYSNRICEECESKIVRCSVKGDGDVCAKDIRLLGSGGTEYVYYSKRMCFAVKTRIPGEFTVYNSLIALALTMQMGISPIIAQDAIRSMGSVPGRMEKLPIDKALYGFSVFIDFAHTEEALRNLLTTVRNFRSENERIVLLFGCGGDRDKTKRAPIGRCASELADFLIITSDNSRSENPENIINDILCGITDETPKKVITNRHKAIEYAILNARKDDIILLVGKGHEKYEITECGHRDFDEKKIVAEALEKRKNGEKYEI
ncbi:MAG: UDP-N-acetylmuramoyl-L-alanyl-D-glutamate--2,6-diaminopimelate ligase [Eubacteriales bacterium]|nr:UDP-N-acetylmuramoyl-L-alanyl-D-glutamate--2,6-diaminopimelate ligase [Eubacteriales bacterium]